jgi:hypothetical protein
MNRKDIFNDLTDRARHENLCINRQGDRGPAIVTEVNMDGPEILYGIEKTLGGHVKPKTNKEGLLAWVAFDDEAAGIIEELIPYLKKERRNPNVKIRLYHARRVLKAWTEQKMEISDAQRILQEESAEQDED